MNKKADLSMNMIILAAISLLVLAIIAYLIFGASGDINRAKDCNSMGGECRGSALDCGGDFPVPNPAAKCENQEICCIRAGNNNNG